MGNRPLVQVLKALAQVLVQPDGAEAFAKARPSDVGVPQGADENALQQMLQTWVVHMHTCAKRLQDQESDRATIWCFAKVIRELQQIVEACATTRPSAEDAEHLTAAWLGQFIDKCANGVAMALDGARLQQLAQAGNSRGGATRQCLSDFGVRLPPGTAKGVEVAVVARLVEAEQSDEVEMFTGEKIVSGGRAVPGLAAVLRPGQTDDGPRLFLYNFASICKWHGENGTEPTTREVLDCNNILPLTGQCGPVGVVHDMYVRRAASGSCINAVAAAVCASLVRCSLCPIRRKSPTRH